MNIIKGDVKKYDANICAFADSKRNNIHDAVRQGKDTQRTDYIHGHGNMAVVICGNYYG